MAILSIEELELEDKLFDRLIIEEAEGNIECYKMDGHFIIRAHHRGLIQGLTIFKEWVEKYTIFEPVYPFTEILKRIHRIFSDGVIDDAEKEELTDIMRQITGRGLYSDPSQNYSSELPLDAPSPAIQFEDSEFVITGRFGFGTRAKVAEEIKSSKSSKTKK